MKRKIVKEPKRALVTVEKLLAAAKTSNRRLRLKIAELNRTAEVYDIEADTTKGRLTAIENLVRGKHDIRLGQWHGAYSTTYALVASVIDAKDAAEEELKILKDRQEAERAGQKEPTPSPNTLHSSTSLHSQSAPTQLESSEPRQDPERLDVDIVESGLIEASDLPQAIQR